MDTKKNSKISDLVGICCGVFVAVVLAVSAFTGVMTPSASAETGEPAVEEKPILATVVSNKVETGVAVTVKTAEDWKAICPEVYESHMRNQENDEIVEYTEEFPYLKVLYEDFGFSKFYGSARGHYYDLEDIFATGRPHALANCFTCKTPNFTAMVNEKGDEAYSLKFDDISSEMVETISCYNCHGNTPPTLTVTHSYLSDAVGEDFEKIDARTLSCGQCHVEYYFAPDTKATTLPYSNLSTMNPDDILAYYNNLLVDGQPFADYVNPRTGVRQIKVQHTEFETFLGKGSVLNADFTCSDCHMGKETTADGKTYTSHYYTSPLTNETLIASTCSECHEDLAADIHALQDELNKRTDDVALILVDLTEQLAAVVEKGEMAEDKLNEVRSLARDAQFYWDFVFVENSEGAHNSALTNDCLDKAEKLANEAIALLAA